MRDLKPCPFCGSKNLIYNWTLDEAMISCACGAKLVAMNIREHYERIEGDIYRKIPQVDSKDVVVEKWNRRAE